MEISAKTRDGIDSLFNNIVNVFLERNGVVEISSGVNLKLDKNNKDKSSICC